MVNGENGGRPGSRELHVGLLSLVPRDAGVEGRLVAVDELLVA